MSSPHTSPPPPLAADQYVVELLLQGGKRQSQIRNLSYTSAPRSEPTHHRSTCPVIEGRQGTRGVAQGRQPHSSDIEEGIFLWLRFLLSHRGRAGEELGPLANDRVEVPKLPTRGGLGLILRLETSREVVEESHGPGRPQVDVGTARKSDPLPSRHREG